MPLTAETWNAVVKKQKKASTAFGELDRAVRIYLTYHKSSDYLPSLKTAWDAWNKECGGYLNSKRYVKEGALDEHGRSRSWFYWYDSVIAPIR